MATLELDVGNTRLKWRLREGDRVLARGAEVRADYPDFAALLQGLEGRLGAATPVSLPDGMLVASVAASDVAAALADWGRSRWRLEPRFARVTSECDGVRAGYEQVERLGVDRWLAVLAAANYAADGVLVVDCGSAVTADVLLGKQHLGGYIAPGLRLMNSALFKDTARVRVGSFEPGSGEPGRDTPEAVHAGLQLMLEGFVRQVLARLQAQGWWQGGFRGRLLLTGGDARLVAGLLARETAFYNIQVVEDLVLDGLLHVATRTWPWN